MVRGSSSAATMMMVAALCMVASPRPVDADGDRLVEAGMWDISVGVGSLYGSAYDGADEMELRVLPMVNIEWNDRLYLSVPRGIGVHLYRGGGFTISSGLGYSTGRPDDHDDLNGLGDIDPAVTVNGGFEYRLGPVTPYGTLTQHLGGTDGLTAEVGVRAMVPLAMVTGDIRPGEMGGGGPPPGPAVMLGFSAEWANETYMERYFGVNGEQAVRSGLNRHDADAGFYALGTNVGVMYVLGERWLLNGTFGYTWITGDAEDSPIVQQGEQFNGGVFVSYRF